MKSADLQKNKTRAEGRQNPRKCDRRGEDAPEAVKPMAAGGRTRAEGRAAVKIRGAAKNFG